MIPSYFKIEILAIQDEFVLSGRKGLKLPPFVHEEGHEKNECKDKEEKKHEQHDKLLLSNILKKKKRVG